MDSFVLLFYFTVGYSLKSVWVEELTSYCGFHDKQMPVDEMD
jgi:hypothetical protein